MIAPTLLLDGLGFGEGLRWHDGRLFFSDFVARTVTSLRPGEPPRLELELDDKPSGLGWLPDGSLVVVSMHRRAVLRQCHGEVTVHADLSQLLPCDANDMVVDADGTCYVGNFGSDLLAGEPPRPTVLAVVFPDGTAELTGIELSFPNGMVITAARELVVGETLGGRYTSFPIGEDRRLGAPRLWADVSGRAPDGCAAAVGNAIWFADAAGRAVVLVAEGGAELAVIDTEDTAYACAVGGDTGETLFFVTCPTPPVPDLAVGGGRLWSVDVSNRHDDRRTSTFG